jgi:GT2 family glycosyltransferase
VEQTRRPAATVVIPTHSEQRWDSLVRAVASARSQTHRPAEIIVVVDHNPALYRRVRRDLGGITVLENAYAKGVSGTRNTGAFTAPTSLIAFLDDDTSADPDWLDRLVRPFGDPTVVGAGGGITPDWQAGRPRWMPEEFLWSVGGSYAGLPTRTAPIRNVWSASMVVRRDVFIAVGGFRVGFGKLGDQNRPEDTELCLRMSAEGRGKVQMAALDTAGDPLRTEALGTERAFLRSLPKTVVRNLGAALTGRGVDHAFQAGSVVAGVAAAAYGGAVETVTARRAQKLGNTR